MLSKMLVEIYYTEYSGINKHQSQVRKKTSLSMINSKTLPLQRRCVVWSHEHTTNYIRISIEGWHHLLPDEPRPLQTSERKKQKHKWTV